MKDKKNTGRSSANQCKTFALNKTTGALYEVHGERECDKKINVLELYPPLGKVNTRQHAGLNPTLVEAMLRYFQEWVKKGRPKLRCRKSHTYLEPRVLIDVDLLGLTK